MVRIPALPNANDIRPAATDAEWLLSFKRRTGLSSTDIARILGTGARRITGWSAGQEPISPWGKAALFAFGGREGWRPSPDGKCRMTREGLVAFKKTHGLTNERTAALWDIATRRVAAWCSGEDTDLPLWLEGACRGYDLGWRPADTQLPGKVREAAE